MNEDRLLLDALADMTAASVTRVDLDPAVLMLVRLAALAAVNAPTSSYLLNLGVAADTGLTLEDARSVLIAVAPIIGAPRVLAAAGTIAQALGLALAVAVAEEEAEEEADEADEA